MEPMLDAKREIIDCITGRLPSGGEVAMRRHIADAIEHMAGKGVSIRYLLPKFPDRLQVGLQYMRGGGEVFFGSCIIVHNLRYIVVDEKIIVLGIPEITAEKEAMKKGYTISSEGLAALLRDYFSDCEDKTNLRDYLQEVLKQA